MVCVRFLVLAVVCVRFLVLAVGVCEVPSSSYGNVLGSYLADGVC